MNYRIFLEGEAIEEFDDLLEALPRSRALSGLYERNYEIRNAEDVIIAVALTTKRGESGAVMNRAAKHNARIEVQRLASPATMRCCPVTRTEHVWAFEDRCQNLFRCADCRVIGYRVMPKKFVTHRCSICERPATHIRPGKRVSHHRWSCEAHVEL